MATTREQHICFIFTALGLGGAERQMLAYLPHRPPSIRISVLFFNNVFQGTEADMARAFAAAHVELIHFPMLKANLSGVLALARKLRQLKPDIVHTVLDGSAGTWGRLAAVLAGIPLIVHSDRSLNPPVSAVQSLLRPFLDRRTRLFFPNAQAIAQGLYNHGADPSRVIVVANGVDTTAFDPETVPSPRGAWGVSDDAIVAGFLGRFSGVKRIDLLLDSILALPEEFRPDHVVLGGDGPLFGAISNRVSQDLWLKTHCILAGQVSDVPAFIAGIDYLVLCSDREGLPNVVLEAMAMAKPVIGTRVSDVPTLLDGIGFLVAPGAVQEMACSIEQMQRLSPGERQEFGRRSRARVLERYTIQRAAAVFWQGHLEVLR